MPSVIHTPQDLVGPLGNISVFFRFVGHYSIFSYSFSPFTPTFLRKEISKKKNGVFFTFDSNE